MRSARTVTALTATLAAGAMLLAGCSSSGDGGASGSPSTTPPAATATSDATQATPAAGALGGDCTPEAMKTLTAGTFTVGTDTPAYEPWFVDNDPSNGKGYESAVAYAVAEKLGYSADQVKWATVSFQQAIQPGPKTFDVDINQVSISDERKKSVDFSSGYYDVTQAVITAEGSKVADATSVADLKDATIGAMVGSTSLQAITEVIKPTKEPQVFNDNDAAKQALIAGTVDAIVVDLPTALYITSAEMDNGKVVGQLPGTASQTEQFGMVLDLGSPLTSCVSQAVDALRADGTLDELSTQWLANTSAPVLS